MLSSSTFAAHLPSTNWAGNLNLILGTHSARREVCLLQNGCFKYCNVVNLKININKPLLRMVYYWLSFMKRKPITLGYCGVLLRCLKRPTKCVPVQSCDAVRPLRDGPTDVTHVLSQQKHIKTWTSTKLAIISHPKQDDVRK